HRLDPGAGARADLFEQLLIDRVTKRGVFTRIRDDPRLARLWRFHRGVRVGRRERIRGPGPRDELARVIDFRAERIAVGGIPAPVVRTEYGVVRQIDAHVRRRVIVNVDARRRYRIGVTVLGPGGIADDHVARHRRD